MKKLSYLFEIPLFYLALAGLNLWLWPEEPGFPDACPHPAWIGVLLFSFRYGVSAGVVSGAAAAAFRLAMTWVFGERFLFADAAFFTEPGLFVLTGMLLGAGASGYRSRISASDVRLKAMERELADAREESATFRDAAARLEKKLVTRMATLVTLYEGSRRLEANDPDKIFEAVLSLVVKALEAEQAAVYVRGGGAAFELFRGAGWSRADEWPSAIEPARGVGGLALSRGRVVTVRDFLAEAPSGGIPLGECVMAGPLREGEGGGIKALVCVQRLAFVNFNSAAVNLFSFLLDWGSRSLGRSRHVAMLREDGIMDLEWGAYSYRYFLRRAEDEFARSRAYYLPLSLAMIGLSGGDALAPERRPELKLALARLLRESCRPTDVVAVTPEDGFPFACLMPTASARQAAENRARIEDNLARLALPGSVRIRAGIASFTPRTKDVEELIAEAKREAEL